MKTYRWFGKDGKELGCRTVPDDSSFTLPEEMRLLVYRATIDFGDGSRTDMQLAVPTVTTGDGA